LAKSFYCDGAKAFKKMAALLRIPAKNSTPNTPNSNARQESWMRILGDGVRTLLYSAGLTAAFWPYAGLYFCNAWNILRVNPRTGKTAYEFRYPNRNTPMLMPFGVTCTYVPPARTNIKTDDQKTKKLETRGKEAILLGYYAAPGEAGFKEFVVCPLSNFLDNKTHTTVINTRDVRFSHLAYPVRELRFGLGSGK
jgi:hypothetical protein